MEIVRERMKRSGYGNPGIAWEWIPGNLLPPKDTTRASGNSATETKTQQGLAETQPRKRTE